MQTRLRRREQPGSGKENRAELLDGGGGGSVEAVPAEPKDEYAKRTERDAVTGEGVDLYNLAFFVPVELADTGTEQLSADERRDAADHMYRAGACEIVEAELAEPATAPDPVRLDRIDEGGYYCGVNAVGKEFSALAIAPDTIVAVVAQNTRLKTKLEKSKSE